MVIKETRVEEILESALELDLRMSFDFSCLVFCYQVNNQVNKPTKIHYDTFT